jgi:lysophospholipase L1-like esterase
VTYIIVLIGINDIGSNLNSSQIISAYKQIIEEAHKNNLFIYAGIILPFGNCKKWNKEKEIIRQEVNNWIRNTKSENGGFDAIFDFDKFIKDSNVETKMIKEYDCGDGLHPSPEGHKKIAEAIDNLELFTNTFIKI